MRKERERGTTYPATAKVNNSTRVKKTNGTRSLENGIKETTDNFTVTKSSSVSVNHSSVNQRKTVTKKRSSPPPPLVLNQEIPINVPGESGFAMLEDALESFNEVMSSPSSKQLNHSGERSAFSKPSTNNGLTPRYYCSSPHDKLSDYEDVWSPKPSAPQTPLNFFKPIGKGSSVSSLDSLMVKDSDRMSMHNPGYISDAGSDKERDFIDQSFVVDLTKPVFASSPNTERQSRKKSKSKPVMRNHTVHNVNYERRAAKKVTQVETVQKSSKMQAVIADGIIQRSTSEMSSNTQCIRRTTVKSQSVPRDILSSKTDSEETEYENLVNGVPLMPRYSPQSFPVQNSRPKDCAPSAPCLGTSEVHPPVHEVKSDPILSTCVIPLSQYIIPNDTAQSQSSLMFQAAPTLPLHCTRTQSLPTEDLSPEPPPVPPKNLDTPPASPSASPVMYKPPPHPSNLGNGPRLSPSPPRKGMPSTSDSFEKNFELMQKLEGPDQMQRFPLDISHHTPTQGISQRTSYSESSTVEDLIQDTSPNLSVKPIMVERLTEKNLQRISDYDNVSGVLGPRSRRTVASSATTYCVPWDSNIVQKLMDNPPTQAPPPLQTPPTQAPPLAHPETTEEEDDDYSSVSAYAESGCPSECATSTFGSCSQKKVGGGENETPDIDGLANKLGKNEICVSDDEGMEDDHGMNPLLGKINAPSLYE